MNWLQKSIASVLSATLLSSSWVSAQAPASPIPTCIRNVTIDSSADEAQLVTLILRDGRIAQILGADAATPAGMREVDGEGLLCLPAFVDAISYTGVQSPSPAIDQDKPVDVGADVRVDMRQANRKGIQPAFSAARALAIESKDSEAWREAGFGTAHLNPARNLLGGTSCVAATREAAARDLVLRADAFSSAAFSASGAGYPQTLMGYIAQLRQFFLDAGRHAELQQRYAAERPGARPAFDAELEAGARILAGESVLLCEVVSNRDVERWLKMSDRFGFKLALSGGRDAWRVAAEIAAREIPVLLTNDWGKEVKDPLAKKQGKQGKKKEAAEPSEEDPVNREGAEDVVEAAADVEQEEGAAAEADEDEERSYTYEEPLAARIDRRKEWEKRRDCALRLHEAGVRIAFGSGAEKPSKLLENARAMVEAGLPREVALAAMTSEPARILGLGQRLGRLQAGFDANLTLWSADPLTDDKAKPVYIYVDGFETEYERPKAKQEGAENAAPAEGLDVSGNWSVQSDEEDDGEPTRLALVMSEDGVVSGTLTTQNPQDQSELTTEVTGNLRGNQLTLEAVISMGDMEVSLGYELEVDGDTVSGQLNIMLPVMPEPMERSVSGSRIPDSNTSH